MMIPDRVYHLVEASNWPSVQSHGLLSACELFRLTDVPIEAQVRISTTQRLQLTALSDQVAIRDQLLMPSAALQKCLVGMTPAEWYALLNQMLFFWCDRERLNRQLKACGGRPQVVLTLDTKRLLARHADRVALTPFNTGMRVESRRFGGGPLLFRILSGSPRHGVRRPKGLAFVSVLPVIHL